MPETQTQSSPDRSDPARRDAFMQRMFGALVAGAETQSAYLGLRLGYYDALAQGGAATAAELAQRAGTDERYTREWLEQQAVAGFLDVAEASPDAMRRRYAFPPEHAEVLLNADSTNFLGFVPPLLAATALHLDALRDAYRTGSGVAWEAYGEDLWRAQGDQNRAFLRHVFAPQVLPSIPAVDERLRADPPARVADIACGVGWAAIAIAEHYPKIRAHGLDLDADAVEAGRAIVAERGLSERVHLDVRDAADPALEGQYDLVTIVEALHDMAHPVAVLRAARDLLAPGGSLVIVDENVLESFEAPGPETERAFYGFSVLACLANGRTEEGSAMTGTVMRPETVKRYATEAGFNRFEIVPFPHDFFRFYRLQP